MDYNFSDAKRGDFDLIPARTNAPVVVSIKAGDEGTPEKAFKVVKDGQYMLQLELTISEGDYAGRKIWHNAIMGGQPSAQLTEGQEKAVQISRTLIRSMLEAARGYAPTDESKEAVAARQIGSIFELEGLEFWIEVGIEKDKKGEYPDKNKIQKILPFKEGEGRPVQTQLAGTQQTQRAPAAGGKPTNKPAWAQ